MGAAVGFRSGRKTCTDAGARGRSHFRLRGVWGLRLDRGGRRSVGCGDRRLDRDHVDKGEYRELADLCLDFLSLRDLRDANFSLERVQDWRKSDICWG